MTTSGNLGTNDYTIGGMYDTWGDAFVADMAILNKFAGATHTVSDTSGDITLTVTQCQNFSFMADGSGATVVNLRVPDSIARFWYVRNDRASGSITVRCAAGGTAVTLAAGERRLVHSDGTNCVDLTLLTIAIASVSGLQAALDAKAALASPTFTGTPAAPTPSPGDNDTSIATTAFVKAAIDVVLGGVSASYDTLAELASALSTLDTEVDGKLASADVASAANFRANTADKVLDTDGVWSAAAEVTLTDAATIAVDMSTFLNAVVTLGGNRTLGQPSNVKVGQSGVIRIVQDGAGSRTLAYHADWEFASGTAPVLSTAIGAQDLLFYHVLAANRIFASLIKAVA